jgi:hypothetical protein
MTIIIIIANFKYDHCYHNYKQLSQQKNERMKKLTNERLFLNTFKSVQFISPTNMTIVIIIIGTNYLLSRKMKD